MARRVRVETLCDLCLAAGEDVEGVELPEIPVGGRSRLLALCEAHRKELWDGLADALRQYGQAVGHSEGKPAASPAGKGGDHRCPLCPLSYRTKGSLQAHVRSSHDTTLAEAVGEPVPFRCPECGKRYSRPQACSLHRVRTHGVAKGDARVEATSEDPAPEPAKPAKRTRKRVAAAVR